VYGHGTDRRTDVLRVTRNAGRCELRLLCARIMRSGPHYALHAVRLSVRLSRVFTVDSKTENHTTFKLRGQVTDDRSNWRSDSERRLHIVSACAAFSSVNAVEMKLRKHNRCWSSVAKHLERGELTMGLC